MNNVSFGAKGHDYVRAEDDPADADESLIVVVAAVVVVVDNNKTVVVVVVVIVVFDNGDNKVWAEDDAAQVDEALIDDLLRKRLKAKMATYYKLNKHSLLGHSL